MAYKSNLRPASFRGVSFDVLKTVLSVGRRVQVFEYPQRDVPFVEDLGKSARTITVTVITTGDDYISRMKKVIAALEKEGSGRYVDPWLGTMTVTPKSTSSPTFSSTHVASITITFVESGEYRFPNALIDTGSLCESVAQKLRDSALGAFVKDFNLEGATDFVKKAVSGDIEGLLSNENLQFIGEILNTADGLADVASDALTLVEGGADVLGGRLMDVLGLAGVGSTVAAWSSVARRISRLVSSDDFNSSATTSAKSQEAVKVQEAAVVTQALIRAAEVANAIEATTQVGTEYDKADSASTATTIAYEDMVSIRNEVLEIIDAEMLKTDSDDVYRALEEARSAVYQDMTTRAENRARLVDYTPPEVLPALVLAYERYGDATREAEIIERNKIAHGSFVPAKALKLLNE